MIKRPLVHYGRMPEPITPYQKAAQVWDERIGSARVQAKNWRLMAFGCLILSAGLAGGLVWQSSHGSITPWVVEVDHLGQAQRVAPANFDYQPTDAQIAYHLARFIEDVRGLPADGIVLRQNWLRAYDFTIAAPLRSTTTRGTMTPLPSSVRRKSPSTSRASFARRRKAFGSHGPSAPMTTVR